MIKFKQTKEGTFTIKGLELKHLQSIMTLVSNTRCGPCLYERAVTELGDAFDKFETEDLEMDDCVFDVDGLPDAVINLSHFSD